MDALYVQAGISRGLRRMLQRLELGPRPSDISARGVCHPSRELHQRA